ncbi:hypothetical protein OG735_11175 [Streptomyces sp. NBC_01210]|uniref:hypothetical protein n=1 Tax=Streptomyces sp. NBC_01210 TaxID=2903774 RepID=UPI002E0F6616|nr:hypothetical protein OG735_11175 [Streptomyces sp. NBC_01210]
MVAHIAAAVGVAVVIGLLAGLSGALCNALVQTRTDPASPGRVTSVSTFFSLGAAPLSHPVTGAAGRPVGHRAGLTVSVAVRALGAVHGVCSKGLRSAELPR